MRIIGEEGFLLFVEDLPEGLAVGDYWVVDVRVKRVVFVDRVDECIGLLPVKRRTAQRVLRGMRGE